MPTANDILVFNGSATVKLDQNGDADCWAIVVNAGEVRIETDLSAKTAAPLEKDDGPWLNMKSTLTGAEKNGWNVKKGAKLDIAVPTWCETRTDKWYGGELWFHAPLRLKGVSYFGYGTNCFAQGANVYSERQFTVGLGASDTGLRDCVIFTDNAVLNGAKIVLGGGDDCTSNTLEIDGDSVWVDINNFVGNDLSMAADQHLVVKRGTMNVHTSFLVEKDESVRPGRVLVSGGLLNLDKNCVLGGRVGTVRVEGGRIILVNPPDLLGDAFIELAGGTLYPSYVGSSADKTFRFEPWLHHIDGFVEIASGSILDWDFSNAVIAEGATVGTVGMGDVRFSKSQVVTHPLSVRDGTATIASGVTLTGPASGEAWGVTLGRGAKFQFTDITSRLSVPVDAVLNDGGQFYFSNLTDFYHGFMPARSIVTNGIELAKGRYVAGLKVVAGKGGVSTAIPYRWTGNGGDSAFSNPANWEGNAVPPSGANTAIDLSAATRVELDGDYTLTTIVYLPAGDSRSATFAVNGTLTLDTAERYSCATYVKEGCRLTLDATVLACAAGHAPQSALGGGTLAVKTGRDAASTMTLTIDGTVALDGKFSTLTPVAHDAVGCGKVLIEDGAELSVDAFVTGVAGTADTSGTIDEVRQTGGTATFGELYLEKTQEGGGSGSYFLEGGTLNARIFNVGGQCSYIANSARRPGSTFVMTGGALNMSGEFHVDNNQNRAKFFGGTVTLGGDWSSGQTGSYGVTDLNTDHYHFGGVKLKASANSQINGNVTLTGVGGDTILVSDEAVVTLGHWGNTASVSGTARTVSGPGGIVMNGTKTVNVDGVMTFTGGITVNNTFYAYIGNDVASEALNGPRFIKVNNETCTVSVRPTVLKDPEVISVKNAAKFTCSGNFAKGHNFKVKRYILNDVEQPDGTYNAGNCTITVQHDTTWLDGDKGNLSYVGDSVAENDVTLSELRYTPFEPETSGATLSGSSTVTLGDGAVIEVGEGQTLVVSNSVNFAGDVRKIGFGKVVFAGPVTGGAEFTVERGDAEFSGSLAEVTVAASGELGCVPGVALADGLVFHDTAALDIQDGAQFAMDGTISFVQNDAAGEQIFDLPFAGSVTIVQKGPGTLVWASEAAPVAIRAEAGAVRLGTGDADLSGTALVLGGTATVDLSEADLVTVLSAEVDGLSVKAGDYVEGKKALGKRITGAGTMRVLTGSGPGSLILIR